MICQPYKLIDEILKATNLKGKTNRDFLPPNGYISRLNLLSTFTFWLVILKGF